MGDTLINTGMHPLIGPPKRISLGTVEQNQVYINRNHSHYRIVT